jgi:hypothetical protein
MFLMPITPSEIPKPAALSLALLICLPDDSFCTEPAKSACAEARFRCAYREAMLVERIEGIFYLKRKVGAISPYDTDYGQKNRNV